MKNIGKLYRRSIFVENMTSGRITAGSPNAAQRELEGNGEYNLLILDIDVFHGNSDIAVSLVERLKKQCLNCNWP